MGLFKNLFRKDKKSVISYPKNHELTKDQVRMISSFFREKKFVLGIDPNTPLGEIARVARLHWNSYEELDWRLSRVTDERDRYKYNLDQFQSKCTELVCELSDKIKESSDNKNFIDWLISECIKLNKESGSEVTKEELMKIYKDSISKSEVNNGIQEE